MFALTCILLAVAASLCNADELVTLTKEDKQALLDAHNRLRSLTAKGQMGGQPQAANMAILEWDDRLMESANNWVQQCIMGHDKPTLTGYSYVGQNWAGGYSSNFSSYVQMWFDEISDYTYSTKTCSSVCGHYTQVVWAKTMLIGCGISKCSNYPYNVVCNYAFGGNYNGEFPYVTGTPGSQCGADYAFTQGGLCVRKDQCSGSGCTCTVSSCQNGGTVDTSNCKCNCPDGFYGDKCENKCEDAPSYKAYCDAYGQEMCTGKYKSYAPYCASTCNLCRPTIKRDLNVVNRDGVSARVPSS